MATQKSGTPKTQMAGTYRTHLLVCAGTGCVSNHAFDVKEALEKEIKKQKLQKEILVITTGCHGFCERGPMVHVQPDDVFYQQLDVEGIPYLVEEHFVKGRPVEKYMYKPPKAKEVVPRMSDIEFFKHQQLIVLRNRGRIDPEQIDEYIAYDGYKALAKALMEMKPEEIIQEIKDSGLRGRGGAGFPTGNKWEMCRNNPGDKKYIVCNADEGDPGAFMDRSVLEADPHSVIEGMAIGAYAIGAQEGFVYVRHEYPLALERLIMAIDDAKAYGLLGDKIFGTDFSFTVHVVQGGGAFVCGEESALLASIMGRRPEPVQRPPFPVQKGLWGMPTNINNVETWGNVPQIIHNGSEWFSNIGTKGSKGTKIFSLVGKTNNTGLVEVPMGITLKEIVYGIGGGIQNNKKLKAVQSGGPSGGCIPAKLIDSPVDYESLRDIGSMMGSGGLIVMDEDTCMVDLAKYFMNFLQDESCGKCMSCREGTKRLYEILDKISRGMGEMKDLVLLEDLAAAVMDASMCGLGQTASNPVLTTLQYFREEYEEHIIQKKCRAGVCNELISSPCQHICPIGSEVPQYVGFIALGEFEKAYDVIVKDNPLLSVCARVCHHPCEMKCRAGLGGEPVAIRALKRAAIDYGNGKKAMATQNQKGDRVAIVGSGPSGLMAAYHLALKGQKPTIFEALSIAGGMLAVAIPEYRLPRKDLQEDIERIKNIGVEIKLNQRMGKEFSIQDLFESGFKAVYLALGAHKSLKLSIPGEEADGVIPAMKFLTAIHLGKDIQVGKQVAVVGGGNSAIDAARIAHRLAGVEKVTVLYRRTRSEMPAYLEEIEGALAEGIDIQFLTTPVKVNTENNKLKSIECIRLILGDYDKSGRKKPVPLEGSEFLLDIDTLIPAISEQPDITGLDKTDDLNMTRWGTIDVDPETQCTNVQGVFAGGDVVRGPNTVIEAMSDGKRAAEAIDMYLKGQEIQFDYTKTRPSVYADPVQLTEEEMMNSSRAQIPQILPSERVKNFKEVYLTYEKEAAIQEAKRCLRCDLSVKRIDEEE